MDSTELRDQLESEFGVLPVEVVNDAEIWRMIDTAYKQFVRSTGGIPDFTSEVTELVVADNVTELELSPLVLRIQEAYRQSDNGQVRVINTEDLTRLAGQDGCDYGALRRQIMRNEKGRVDFLLTGAQKNIVRPVKLPTEVDVIRLMVYRLPLIPITDYDQTFDDVDEQHHIHLLDYVKHLMYRRPGSKYYDLGQSESYRKLFEAYCEEAKCEAERARFRPGVIQYGGL